MNDTAPTPATISQTAAAPQRPGFVKLLWFALPLLALVLAAGWLTRSDWLKAFDTGAPPVEKLTFERTVLDSDGIHLKVRAGGSEPITIAQVQINEAYWSFTQDPPGPLDRLASAWLHVPYPWVLGDKQGIKILSKTGVAFKKEIDVAVPTPKPYAGNLIPQALLGAFVGIVPVVIGMLFYPAMQGMSRTGINFVLALTVGLLAFLFIGSLKEALELGIKAAAAFQGIAMVLIAAAITFLVLLVTGRSRGAPTGAALATYIALGIGLHNLGEGLAIGAAFAAGVAGLGVFLVLGFTLHNVTEGIGIVAPLLKARPSLATFAGLALLAGAPAILGVWLGSVSYSPQWSALALAVGAGAILQVVVEVGAYLIRNTAAPQSDVKWLSPGTLGGFVIGVAVMYVTGMLVKI
jgi:ZIP family zinc transporter